MQAHGELDEAAVLHRRAYEGREAALGPTHSDTLHAANSLAGLLHDRGEVDEAAALYRRALAGCEATLGAAHPNTLATANNLARRAARP